jgi:hypothetical protein
MFNLNDLLLLVAANHYKLAVTNVWRLVVFASNRTSSSSPRMAHEEAEFFQPLAPASAGFLLQ